MTKGDLLGASAVMLALAAPYSAAAQDRQGGTPPAAQDQGYVSANEIIVTATRRNETVQDVPVAITAISPQLLENARPIGGILHDDFIVHSPLSHFLALTRLGEPLFGHAPNQTLRRIQ